MHTTTSIPFFAQSFPAALHLVHIVCLGIKFQRDGKIRHRLRAQRNLGADPRKEQPSIFHPLLQFGRSLFEHSRRESIVKFPFATTRKNIQIDYFPNASDECTRQCHASTLRREDPHNRDSYLLKNGYNTNGLVLFFAVGGVLIMKMVMHQKQIGRFSNTISV